MLRVLMLLFLALAASLPAIAQVTPFPPSFRTEEVAVDGATLHVRVGGKGPAVVLLHGFGDTGDMWGPMAANLVRDHKVVVPDLRGMGLSSHPEGGYDKRSQAADIRAVLAHLGIDRADVVAHDIGNMVAFAYAVRYPELTTRLVLLDAPVPGIGPWEEIVRNPKLWHFDFGGPDAERLVAGRERILLDRFYNEFSGNPAKVTEATRAHYAQLYARPGAMHSAFSQFAAFRQDAKDNKTYLTSKLTMPVLAIGGEASFGAMQAAVMREAANNVTEVVIPKSGHWLMEEAPTETTAAVRTFLDSAKPGSSTAAVENTSGELRLTPAEFDFANAKSGGTGTSGVAGIQTIVLKGDPDSKGLYTILLKIPPNTTIRAHVHPDERVATVVSGDWSLGYGDHYVADRLKVLPPGSFYTEPAGRAHFAQTRGSEVLLMISGVGPSGLHYTEETH